MEKQKAHYLPLCQGYILTPSLCLLSFNELHHSVAQTLVKEEGYKAQRQPLLQEKLESKQRKLDQSPVTTKIEFIPQAL